MRATSFELESTFGAWCSHLLFAKLIGPSSIGSVYTLTWRVIMIRMRMMTTTMMMTMMITDIQ